MDDGDFLQAIPAMGMPYFRELLQTVSIDKIAVIGLGYVGLPLAVEFGKKFETHGFDLSVEKIAGYKTFVYLTGEISTDELKAAKRFQFSTDPSTIANANFVVVAVPTPVDGVNNPDFTPLVEKFGDGCEMYSTRNDCSL